MSSTTGVVTVGTIVSVEQVQQTAKRIARKFRKAESVRHSPLAIYNIVCTCSLGVKNVNLAAVATALHGRLGTWTPKQNEKGKKAAFMSAVVGVDQKFPSCVSRCRETKTTNSIFASGQIVIGGAKSKEVALASAYLCSERIRFDLGYNTGVYNFRVQNVVSSFGLGYRLNLPLFFHDHHMDCGWDPEEFRGVSWEFENVDFVLFDTGNAVVTGGKTFEDLSKAYTKALVELSKYKLGQEYRKIDARELRTPRKKTKKKVSVIKTRKHKLLTSSYKRTEAQYLNTIRSQNDSSGVDQKPVRQPPKKKLRVSAAPSASAPASASTAPTAYKWTKNAMSVPLNQMRPIAPYQPTYLKRQAPAPLPFRRPIAPDKPRVAVQPRQVLSLKSAIAVKKEPVV